jgi:hypothetical protein
MKIDNTRVIGKDLVEGLTITQTIIINFIPEGDEAIAEVFGTSIKDVPTKKNAIAGEPDLIGCLVNFSIDRKENKIKFNSMSLGVDVYGENPHSEVDSNQIGHWLPVVKTGFRKYDVNTEALSTDYKTNSIVDELKLQLYKRSR